LKENRETDFQEGKTYIRAKRKNEMKRQGKDFSSIHESLLKVA